MNLNSSGFQIEDLMNRTTELEASVQSKEHKINMTREEIQPLMDSAEKHLKTVQELKEVKLHCAIKEEEKKCPSN